MAYVIVNILCVPTSVPNAQSVPLKLGLPPAPSVRYGPRARTKPSGPFSSKNKAKGFNWLIYKNIWWILSESNRYQKFQMARFLKPSSSHPDRLH